MHVTEGLLKEHDAIGRFMDLLQKASERARRGGFDDIQFFERAVTFIRDYIDALHHSKEEKVLIPAMERAGLDMDNDVLKQIIVDHQKTNKLIADIDKPITDGDLDTIIKSTLEYINLLQGHAVRENNFLFPAAEKMLNDEQKAQVLKEFEKMEAELMDNKEHDYMLEEIDRMESYL